MEWEGLCVARGEDHDVGLDGAGQPPDSPLETLGLDELDDAVGGY